MESTFTSRGGYEVTFDYDYSPGDYHTPESTDVKILKIEEDDREVQDELPEEIIDGIREECYEYGSDNRDEEYFDEDKDN